MNVNSAFLNFSWFHAAVGKSGFREISMFLVLICFLFVLGSSYAYISTCLFAVCQGTDLPKTQRRAGMVAYCPA